MNKKETTRVLKGTGRFLVEVSYNIAFIVILVAIIRNFIISPFSINGSSMVPTLNNEEFIINDIFSYRILGNINRGDIAIFRPHLTKRDNPKFEASITTDPSGRATYDFSELETVQYSDYCLNQFLQRFWFCKLSVEEHDWLYVIQNDGENPFDSPENLDSRQIDSEEAKDGEVPINGLPNTEYLLRIYPSSGSDHFVKRVIGIPGDTVKIENGRVYLKKEDETDFTELHEPYLNEQNRNRTLFQTPPESNEFFVPEDHYFLLGDNRVNSNDSRSFVSPVTEEHIPYVHKDQILGKVRLVLLPAFNMRLIRSADL